MGRPRKEKNEGGLIMTRNMALSEKIQKICPVYATSTGEHPHTKMHYFEYSVDELKKAVDELGNPIFTELELVSVVAVDKVDKSLDWNPLAPEQDIRKVVAGAPTIA